MRRLIVNAALLPVIVPLSILDWLQPIDDAPAWPALVYLPEWWPTDDAVNV